MVFFLWNASGRGRVWCGSTNNTVSSRGEPGCSLTHPSRLICGCRKLEMRRRSRAAGDRGLRSLRQWTSSGLECWSASRINRLDYRVRRRFPAAFAPVLGSFTRGSVPGDRRDAAPVGRHESLPPSTPCVTALDRAPGAAVAPMAWLALGAPCRAAGDRPRTASALRSSVLDLEGPTSHGPSGGLTRCPRVHSRDVYGESNVGCAAHSRGASEAGDLGQSPRSPNICDAIRVHRHNRGGRFSPITRARSWPPTSSCTDQSHSRLLFVLVILAHDRRQIAHSRRHRVRRAARNYARVPGRASSVLHCLRIDFSIVTALIRYALNRGVTPPSFTTRRLRRTRSRGDRLVSVDRARLAHWTSPHGRNRRYATTDRKFPRVSFGPARILDAGRHDTETRPATGCFVTRLVRHPG